MSAAGVTLGPVGTPADTGPVVGRVGLVSVHTSPLDQPGMGDGGGLNVYVLQVARRLAARGVAVDVFTRRTDYLQPEIVQIGERLLIHRIVAGPEVPLDKAELPNHLSTFVLNMLDRRVDVDILHAHYWLSGWVARRVADRWEVPYVQTFHTLAILKNAALAPGDEPEPPLRLSAERRIAHEADKVVGLTCGEARLLHRSFGLSGADIAVVPAGVDLDLFKPGDETQRSSDPLLLFVGRLQPLKGPDVAIRTLAAVRQQVPDARLVVVGGVSGTGEGRSGPTQLRHLADAVGVGDAVEFLPACPQEELVDLYRAAHVVVVPSRSETFGLVALEAQACGTPVVAADVGGLHYLVGAGGRLVPGHDPADHAAAVVELLLDPQSHREASEEAVRAARGASWERTVDRLLGVYRGVLQNRSRYASAG